ncbi:hypothetical protein EV122DRAFT_275548 [Schizophyllum commune]
MANINISWKNPNEYASQPAKKQQIETTVQNAAATTAAVDKGATDATIRGSSHKSPLGGDQVDHVTVDYQKANGDHVTTKHIPT